MIEGVDKMQGNFIQRAIQEDLGADTHLLHTRYPPEPGGYLHIGHAKAITINYGLAEAYGGKYNLRMDDTDPTKADMDYYVGVIKDSVTWLGFDVEGKLFYASDYFEKFYEYALVLIKAGVAYVCELNGEQMREYRGTLTESGKNSPYRERSIEENLDLFARMKAGEFPNGAKTLRAKIDMSSPNMNMRDPVIYRIIHEEHYNAPGWCIYPIYDFAHPLGDAIEGITHSLCGLEFENNRPLYDWYIKHVSEGTKLPSKPRQIEFAELHLTNTILGKRNIRKLIADGVIEDWDDPRLLTFWGMKRRGYRPAALRAFCDAIGVAKAHSKVDIAMLEHFVREDLAPDSKVVMAVLEPVRLVIEDYPDDRPDPDIRQIANNPKNEAMGTREVPFSRELYIEREDFTLEPPPKYQRLAPGHTVRLFGANMAVTFERYDEAADALYVKVAKEGVKPNGTIHWVSTAHAVEITANLYDYLVFDCDKAEDGFVFNENSLTVMRGYAEPSTQRATIDDRFQFMRNAFYTLDSKGSLTFNRIVELKSSYKL
ncbi:MAG: glutamine--tRNA ligase [Defluviitaleaceae bacterium]|nr:glutamine--tRNA ligase [Defluviitaleaceae bacterium]